MRIIAEFIMRGRVQASVVALAGNLVPLVSPATVGLVTLRRGLQDGLLVLLWACLPLVATLYFASASSLVVMTSLVGMVAVLVAAEVLKGTASWQWTLVATLGLCSALMLALASLFPEQGAVVAREVQEVVVSLASTERLETVAASPFYVLMAITAVSLGIEEVALAFVLGFLSWLTVMNVIASLLVSRWWQAILFNPGGFQREFHGLRLGIAVASGLMGAVVFCYLASVQYMAWASMLGMPLLLAGIGLMHHLVRFLGLGTFWLVVMYTGLVLIGPLSMVLIVVGFLDSFLDFRTRVARARKA